MRLLLIVIFFFVGLFSITSCRPPYLIKAAYLQSKILLKRQAIEKAIQDKTLTQEQRDKLQLILQARSFAQERGLAIGKAYTTFSSLNQKTLSWVVAACKKDSLVPHFWWFPIVGSVPYKGFFEEDDARKEAENFSKQGYDVLVRPVDAFSSLGWFNDPVISPMLLNSEAELVNTILHETFHRTFWLKDNVDFNESAANFVGNSEAVIFFRNLTEQPLSSVSKDIFDYNKVFLESKNIEASSYFISDTVMKLTLLLQEVFKQKIDYLTKISERDLLYQRFHKELQEKIPGTTLFAEPNNAHLSQLILYYKRLKLFRRLFEFHNGSLKAFIQALEGIKEKISSSAGRRSSSASSEEISKDPFELLEIYLKEYKVEEK
jgi:predicted aminopeptidase